MIKEAKAPAPGGIKWMVLPGATLITAVVCLAVIWANFIFTHDRPIWVMFLVTLLGVLAIANAMLILRYRLWLMTSQHETSSMGRRHARQEVERAVVDEQRAVVDSERLVADEARVVVDEERKLVDEDRAEEDRLRFERDKK